MRLKKLKIGNETLEKGYKNFLNTTIDFSEGNYSVFIGLNGSGKSNLLEAISKIFKSLYLIETYNERVDFDFELDYCIKITGITHDIRVKFIANTFNFKSNIDRRINQGEYKNYLPLQVIANYSGEELRLWEEVYSKFYKKYTNQVIDLEPLQNMHMIYLNKYNWTIALISLLCLEDHIILDMLNLDNINGVNIKFEFNTVKYPTYETNTVLELIDYINPGRIQNESMDLVSIKSSDVLIEEGIDDLQKYMNLFNYLYVASMPKDDKIIESIDVIFGDYGLKSLSEGEKKMILVRFIYYFSKDQESLILLDEPDTHIHVSRKKDLVNMVTEEDSFYSVVTTHSPVLVNHFNEENISILIPHEIEGIKAEKANKFRQVDLLTDDSISLLDTSLIVSTRKHILMCEGINDLNYIKKSLEVLNRTQNNNYKALENILMINCGGAGNVKPVFEDVVKEYLKEDQVCLIIFDDDDPGRTSRDKIQEIIDYENIQNVKTFTHPKVNTQQQGDFYMEDYFSLSAYRPILEQEISSANNFKSLESLTRAKKIINNKYKTFDDPAFNNFSVLFDKLIDEFGLREG